MKNKTSAYYQAMLARDARFDGKFFIGVKTTGIYCRPICPARPKIENVEFFATALEAGKAGYRPCLRCRPECAPLSPAWVGKSAVVARALRMIAEHKLLNCDEDQFADQLGVTARHLRRLFEEELGKTPKQLSDINRLDFARKLVAETSLSLTDVAFASGFTSLRRFNDAMKKRFHRAPSKLRKAQSNSGKGVELTLAYRPPLDWNSLLRFFETHAVGGVARVHDGAYERIFKLGSTVGALRLRPCPDKPLLKLHILMDDYTYLYLIVQKIRQMFDLDSDPILVENCFSESPVLSKLVQKYPGLRVPRGWDAYETSICSILGQLVSVAQAQRLAGQLVETYGQKVVNPFTGENAYLFPEPKTLAAQSFEGLGTTGGRKATLREFSRLVTEGKLSLESTQDPLAFRKKLLAVKGIGAWTAEYIALRALGDTDAFPHTDLILKRATTLHVDLKIEQFKPWRGYAAMYLWKEYAEPLSRRKKNETLLP